MTQSTSPVNLYDRKKGRKDELDNQNDVMNPLLVVKADTFQKAIDAPSHYQGITIQGKNGSMTFEAIEIIDSILDHLCMPASASHAIGDALKYILRMGHKASDNASTQCNMEKMAQDAGKAGWYCNRAKEQILAKIKN